MEKEETRFSVVHLQQFCLEYSEEAFLHEVKQNYGPIYHGFMLPDDTRNIF